MTEATFDILETLAEDTKEKKQNNRRQANTVRDKSVGGTFSRFKTEAEMKKSFTWTMPPRYR